MAINTREEQVYVRFLIRDDRALFDQLQAEDEGLASHFDEPLEWTPPEETRSDMERCKISISRSIDLETQEWDDAVTWMVDRSETFHTVFGSRLTA